MANDLQYGLHFLDYVQVLRSRKEIAVAAFLVVVATGVAVTFSLPRRYMASTVIAVKEEAPDVSVWSRDAGGTRYDPFFLRTQFEIIQSVPVVEEVVRRLELTRRLGVVVGESLPPEKALDRAVRVLSGAMRVQQFRDTNLIEIQITLPETVGSAQSLAAETADMVASVYRMLSMKRRLEGVERGLRALSESLEEQKKKVADAQNRVDQIREKYQITIVGGSAGSESGLPRMTLAQLDANRIRVRLELEEKRSRLDKIVSLSTNELLEAARYIVGETALDVLVADKRSAELDLSQKLNASLGTKHPEVIQLQTVVDKLQAKIEEALGGMKKGVQADYEVTKDKYDTLEAEVEKLRASEIKSEAGGYKEFEKAREELEHARRIHDALEIRYVQERIELKIPRTPVDIISPAKPPDENDAVSPNINLNIVLSILLGLMSGLGLAFFVEYLDTSLKTVEDVERYVGLSVIGIIPQKVKGLTDKNADPVHAEAYRVLRANLRFSEKFKGGKTISVTSGGVGEGKSLTLFNLAVVSAQMGERVLIVDSDLHRPRQHRHLGISNKSGLIDVLMGHVKLEEATQATAVPNLFLLPAGKAKTGVHGLLETTRLRAIVAELRNHYDLVLFDSPPMIGVSDSSVLVREMDGVLFVIQHRQYPRILSRRAKEMAENLGANMIGVIINSINLSRDYTDYHYPYEYYQRRRKDKPEA